MTAKRAAMLYPRRQIFNALTTVFLFQKTGIDRIMPAGTEIHEELFDPCGYSMNALVSNSVSGTLCSGRTFSFR